MGFIMHGLEKDDFDRNYSDSTLLKRILGYRNCINSYNIREIVP